MECSALPFQPGVDVRPEFGEADIYFGEADIYSGEAGIYSGKAGMMTLTMASA